jgi:hypothetical protein
VTAGRRGAAAKEECRSTPSAEEFVEFATAASPRLRRTAFLLCGDWQVTEDLTQATQRNVARAEGVPDGGAGLAGSGELAGSLARRTMPQPSPAACGSCTRLWA